MVVHNLLVNGIAFNPTEADSPLVVCKHKAWRRGKQLAANERRQLENATCLGTTTPLLRYRDVQGTPARRATPSQRLPLHPPTEFRPPLFTSAVSEYPIMCMPQHPRTIEMT